MDVSDLADSEIGAARALVLAEAAALEHLAEHIDSSFERALHLLATCEGRVVIAGLGKSGHAGRKIAATFASTGTPSQFVHAAEALHGDAGMLTDRDILVGISNSGETVEVVAFAEIAVERGVPVIAVTNIEHSRLSELAAVTLRLHVPREADPFDVVPTSSVVATLSLGDALAIALMRRRGHGPAEFARHHPAGALARRLKDEMG